MFKLPRIILTYTTLLALVIMKATSCQFFHPTVHFFIINKSEDRKAIDINIKLGGQSVFNDTIKFTNIRPDLQYTARKSFKKGRYTILVTADNGKVQIKQPIMLDSDKFIFVTYSYKATVDSTTLIKKLGFPFAEKLKGQEPKIEIYIANEKPVHL